MEDLKKRLAFPNKTVQYQALSRLQQEVEKKTTRGARINNSTPEIGDLSLLFDTVSGPDVARAEVAGSVILQLVETDIVELNFAINSLLNLVPSAKSLSGVVKTLFDLLILQTLSIQTSTGEYKCPYNLRSPPHPLINVLVNRPDAWHVIIDRMSCLLQENDSRSSKVSVKLLRPFVMFLTCEPQQSAIYLHARVALKRCLVTACQRVSQERLVVEIVMMMIELIPIVPIESTESGKYLCEIVEDLSLITKDKLELKQDTTSPWSSIAAQLFSFGIELIIYGIHKQIDICSLAEQLLNLAETSTEPLCTDSELILLSEALAKSPNSACLILLRLAHTEVKKSTALGHRTASSALCHLTMVQPVLEILGLPTVRQDIKSIQRTAMKKISSEAGLLLTSLELCFNGSNLGASSNKTNVHKRVYPFSYQVDIMCRVVKELTHGQMRVDEDTYGHVQTRLESDIIGEWLKQVLSLLETGEPCGDMIRRLVIAILVSTQSDRVVRGALAIIIKIAEMESGQALGFLPVLLYCLRQSRRPESRLAFLETLPHLATHKYCVAPILKINQTLGQSKDLKAVSVRLMSQLWQRQDRCFPHLLKTITEPHVWDDETSTDDIMLAKASAIFQVCKTKPEQHGAEVLSPLSDILNASSGQNNTTAAVIVLDALFVLCQKEVIDLKSLWLVLGEKFVHETRPLVMVRICRLLSLAHHTVKNTEEEEIFQQDALKSLWLYAQSTDPVVQAAAYKALSDSNLNLEHIRVSHLPRVATEELHQQVELAKNQVQEATGEIPLDLTVDYMYPKVPGSCYVTLLKTLNNYQQLDGYKDFIHSLVKNETENLPRGVFFSSLRRQSSANNQGSSIQAIPSFLSQQYQQCKQPGLRPGLAAGLLFCYDPPMEVSRDGRPRKHYIVRYGKAFLRMFSTLLSEVPVQPSEWHRCALLPQAWNSFMERLFFSLLEGRKAEVELQEKQGDMTGDECEAKKDLAWLWVRDSILDAIKIASRDSPAAQANSVLSLASLCCIVHNFYKEMEKENQQLSNSCAEHTTHSRWTVMCTDTIMSLIDVDYRPKEGLHGLCQQHTALDRSPASSLCSSMSRVAASQLVPVLIATDTERIAEFLTCWTRGLPEGAAPIESPMMAFCNGLALGMTLSGLFHEHYADMTGTKGMLVVWKSLNALEDVCFSTQAVNRSGCFLGLGFAMCGLCNDGKTESRVHTASVLDKLLIAWPQLPVEDNAYQSLCVAMACTAATMCVTNSTTEETVSGVAHKLNEAHLKLPHVSGLSLALGLLTFTLDKMGYGFGTTLKSDLLVSWRQDVVMEDIPPMEKVSKLNGLLSLIGSEQSFVSIPSSSLSITGVDVSMKTVVDLVCSCVINDTNPGIQSLSSWMLGHLHHSACSTQDTKSSVPSSYSYLPESSVVRSLFDFLLDAGRQGPNTTHQRHVSLALQCLTISSKLPPVNWSPFVSAFMRQSYGDEVKTNAVLLAVSQVSSSPSAAVFLSSWLTPPLFTSLPADTQAAIHLHMFEVMKHVSSSTLRMYLERSCPLAFLNTQDRYVQLCVLKGLCTALSVDDPPENVTMMLYEATGRLYSLIPNQIDIPILQAISDCLAQVPDDVLDSITVGDFSDARSQVKGSFVRCYLVATGKQPIGLLNYMVDAYFNASYWDVKTGMWLLVHCLWSLVKSKEVIGTVAKQQWLVELLGHTSSVVTGAMPLADTAPNMTNVINIILGIVSCAISAITLQNSSNIIFFGLDPTMFKSKGNNAAVDTPLRSELEEHTSASLDYISVVMDISEQMMCFLPASLSAFTSKPWNTLISKVLGWITTVIQQDQISHLDKTILACGLMALRHSDDFKPASVWTKAVGITDGF